MLDKLYSLGFSDSAVFWFKAYLTNRTHSVNVNGVFSDPQSIQFDVPQGSILGPLLFIVYINNLPSVVQSCDIQLYADDTLLFFRSNSTAEIETNLSEDLKNIISWLENNFLFLNYSKTKIMLVGSQQKLARVTEFCITARNKTLGGFTSLSILVSGVIRASLGMTILTLFPLKIHLGWACYAKLVRSSFETLVSHCTTP